MENVAAALRKSRERIRADKTLVFPSPGNQRKVADLARAGFVDPTGLWKAKSLPLSGFGRVSGISAGSTTTDLVCCFKDF